MPRWILRQWHVSRVARPAAGAPQQVRAYATKPATLDLKWPSNGAIIVPSSVPATTSKDLLRYIQPHDECHGDYNQTCLLVLVTPAFAQWLNDDMFIQRALERLHRVQLQKRNPWGLTPSETEPVTVEAITAVVDKLPAPIVIHQGIEMAQNEVSKRIHNPPTDEVGFEGLAYATFHQHRNFKKETQASTPDTKGAITFVAAEYQQPEFSKAWQSDTVRLPLANTVFQTGAPTTMIHSLWQKEFEQPRLKLRERTNITHCTLLLSATGKDNQRIAALAIPLIPLTYPRFVEASMGNILRRITGPFGKSVTASEELEQIVPNYLKARDEPSRAVSVWALVIPNEVSESVIEDTSRLLSEARTEYSGNHSDRNNVWQELWRRDPPPWNDLVTAALAKGARLHRVLSGGGGWGKKAGLLSLDPGYGTQASTGAPNKLEDLETALQKVVHSGDYIQFLISPSTTTPDANDGIAQTQKLDKLHDRGSYWGCEFGTIPSTMDAVAGSSWQFAASESNQIYRFMHCFGALTEGSLTIGTRTRSDRNDNPIEMVKSTNVDVPFTRFSIVSTEDPKPDEAKQLQDDTNDEEIIEPIPKSQASIMHPVQASKEFSRQLHTMIRLLDWTPLEDAVCDFQEALLGEMADIEEIIDGRLDRLSLPLIKHFNDQADQVTLTVNGLRKRAIRALHYIHLRAHLINETNQSAMVIYDLHTSLRWHLNTKIIDLRHHPPRRIPLEKILVKLRSFDRRLFFQDNPFGRDRIRLRLERLEQQHPEIKGAVELSDAAKRFEEKVNSAIWERRKKHTMSTGAPLKLQVKKGTEPSADVRKVKVRGNRMNNLSIGNEKIRYYDSKGKVWPYALRSQAHKGNKGVLLRKEDDPSDKTQVSVTKDIPRTDPKESRSGKKEREMEGLKEEKRREFLGAVEGWLKEF